MVRLKRESRNGYEVCNMMLSYDPPHYTWIAGRYPLDPHDTRLTEVVKNFKGMSYAEILLWFRDYMQENPDDGIYVD